MRFILSLVALMAFTVPAMATENTDTQKTILVKGSKSYQVRYSKPETMTSPATVEPAAGVEMQSPKGENQPAIAPSSDEPKPSKMMKLHGKK